MKFFVGRISFEQLGLERSAALNAVETRLKLPPDQVDMLISAGRDALKANKCSANSSMPGRGCGRRHRGRAARRWLTPRMVLKTLALKKRTPPKSNRSDATPALPA